MFFSITVAITLIVKDKDIENIWVRDFVKTSENETVDVICVSLSANDVCRGNRNEVRIISISSTVVNGVSVREFNCTGFIDVTVDFCWIDYDLATTMRSMFVGWP